MVSYSDGIHRWAETCAQAKWQLEEALEFLNGPDFIPAASNAAQIECDGPRHFKFPTPCPSKVEENNIVYGRLYRCAERWQERPVIILLDGYPPVGYHSAFPLLARRFNRAGFNVGTLVAPYNLQRRPRRPIERELFGVCAGYGTERRRESRADWLAA